MMGRKGIGPAIVVLIILAIAGVGGGTYYILNRESISPTGCLVSDVASTCTSNDQCCSKKCQEDTSRPYSQEFTSGGNSDNTWCNFKCPVDATSCVITRFYNKWTDVKTFGAGAYPSSVGTPYSTCQGYNWKITVNKYQKYCAGGWCGDGVKGEDEQCDYKENPTTSGGCLVNEKKTCRDETFGVDKCTWTDCECVGSTRKCASDLQPQKCLNGDWTNFCEGDYCQNNICKYGCFADGRCNPCPKDTTYCSSDGKYVLNCTGTATAGYSEKIVSTCASGCSSAKCKPSPQCPSSCPDHINKCKAWECGSDFQCSLEVKLNYSTSWTGLDPDNKCKTRTCVNGEQKLVNVPDGTYSIWGDSNTGCVNGVFKSCGVCSTTVTNTQCVSGKYNSTKEVCNKSTFICDKVAETKNCECNKGQYRCNPLNPTIAEECINYEWTTMLNCQGEMICQEK